MHLSLIMTGNVNCFNSTKHQERETSEQFVSAHGRDVVRDKRNPAKQTVTHGNGFSGRNDKQTQLTWRHVTCAHCSAFWRILDFLVDNGQ
jgi:hypothetical protein